LRQKSNERWLPAISQRVRKWFLAWRLLKRFDRAHASAALTQDQITRRSELFEKAVERVHFVIIQREALELSGDEAQFFRDYAIPEEIRMHLKPKRLSNEGSNHSPA
jgi:hypothetical protein